MLVSVRELLFRPRLGDRGVAVLPVFLPVLAGVDWTSFFLLQSHPAENQNVRFLGQSEPNDDFISFDPIKAIQVTVDDARHGRKLPAPPPGGQHQWKTVSPSFSTSTIHLAETVAASTAPRLTSLLIERTTRMSSAHHLPPSVSATLTISWHNPSSSDFN